MQNKETKQEQLSFHTENFRKRSRYTFVFVCMIAAFFVITVLNINTGNVHISVPKILRILFLHDGEAVEYISRINIQHCNDKKSCDHTHKNKCISGSFSEIFSMKT